ncbi:MAG: prepilin-type N-terminal cleavage/methylation domain-containing protein [Planctomycetes bacterium]|nr:prepilin-type N-terminal cleavage/methylation domain-containing protein [Planctomycetota bacterium]
MNAARVPNGPGGRPVRRVPQFGFTLIEILMAMFIMALGVVGVMSLFPVGLESTRTAMDATMTDIIGRTGLAMMQCYMNTSEIYDCGTGKPGRPWEYVRWRDPSRSCILDSSDGDKKIRYWRQHDCWVSGISSLDGFYVRFVYGREANFAAGQVRRIQSSSGNLLTIDGNYPSPMNKVPPGLERQRNKAKLIVTRYGFPLQWKPVRLAVVRQVNGSAIVPSDVLDSNKNGTPPIPWGGNEWGGGEYFILFTSGKARGRLLRLSGGGRRQLSVKTGGINLEDDGVRPGDTLSVLGCEDVRPCTFPPNFGQAKFNLRFETPPVIPYYSVPVPPDVKKDNANHTTFSMPAVYSYVCIISTVDAPPPVFADVGVAKTARVDVVVYKNYMRDPTDPSTWRPLDEQPRAIGVFTGFVSPI